MIPDKDKKKAGLAKRVPLFGMLIALAFVLSYLEFLVPINLGLPGVKLGMANLVTVITLYLMRPRDALAVSLVRVVLVGFSFGNISMMIYGLCGSLLSFIVMALLQKSGKLSISGVSIAGGVAHNIGQLLVAMFVLQTDQLVFYVPVLLFAGAVTGAVIGVLAGLILSRLKHMRI